MRKFNLDDFEEELDTPKSEVKICVRCKTENLLSAKFCIECGNKTFKDASTQLRYCKVCEIKLDDTDEECPICGGKKFVGSIDELIQNKLKYSHSFVDKNNELKAKLESKTELINNYKKEIKKLEKSKEEYNKEFLRIKNEVEDLRENNKDKVKELKELIEEAKKDNSLVLKTREIEFEKYNSLEKELVNKQNLLKTVEEEYIRLKQDQENVIGERISAEDELKNKVEQIKSLNKAFSLEYHEFEAAVYASLAHFYFDKDPKKCAKYAMKGYEVNDECLGYIIVIMNDINNSYEVDEIRKWNEFGYKYYNNDAENLDGINHLAYATILSSKESKHYNHEKSSKFIHAKKPANLIVSYYYCLCLERLERYNELTNEMNRVMGEIDKKIYFEHDKERYRKIYAPIKNRMEKRD